MVLSTPSLAPTQVMDDNPYLSEGSKSALAATGALAAAHGSAVTVLMVDPQAPGDGSDDVRIENINW